MQTENFFIVEQPSPEWDAMWNALADHWLNKKQINPTSCLNHGEVWQYMGSSDRDGKINHTFRHRCHPANDRRQYVSIPATDEYIQTAKPVSIF